MYKKKELIFLIIIVIALFIFGFTLTIDKKENEYIDKKSLIVINVDGEIARKTKLEFQSQTTYGSVFLKVKSLLNEYSDLSGYDLYEPIKVSMDINIPTIDRNNHYDSSVFININSATKQQLMSLPQIGEKRSEKILEYIKNNGKIKTWEEFFKIVSMKDEYKNEIKKQAIL